MDNRMKPYDVPHKALRNALSQLSLLAGKTDYSDHEQIKTLYDTGREIFSILTIHAEDENDVTLAMLETRCPGGSKHDMDDHIKIEAEQHKLEQLLSGIYNDSLNGGGNTRDGAEFYLALTEFHGKYLEHTAEEERVTQPLLWKYFTDDELGVFRQKIMSKMTTETLMTWFKFIIPAQSPQERAGFLSGFKKTAPPALFNQAMEVIKKELAHPDFFILQARLEK
ncbi:MAG: hemerythrin domain-containing protein [Bacteroidota bacterium]